FEACSAFTHVTACTLAKSPSDSLHQRLQQSRCLHCCSDCYRVERTSSRAGLLPLWTTTFSRRTRYLDFRRRQAGALLELRDVCFAGQLAERASNRLADHEIALKINAEPSPKLLGVVIARQTRDTGARNVTRFSILSKLMCNLQVAVLRSGLLTCNHLFAYQSIADAEAL